MRVKDIVYGYMESRVQVSQGLQMRLIQMLMARLKINVGMVIMVKIL